MVIFDNLVEKDNRGERILYLAKMISDSIFYGIQNSQSTLNAFFPMDSRDSSPLR